jgi:hypothetical protein
LSELSKKYEDLYGKDARALKEDTLRELSAYDKEQSKRIAAGGEEPRAIAGPYSYTVKELMAQVDSETKIGRDVINALSNLKATLAKGGE